jgi:hypothetical protein
MTRGPVDVEAIAVDYLLAELTGVNASTELPGALVPPFVRVGRVGSTFVDRAIGRLERVRIDLDCRGADQGASFDVAASAVTALLELNDVPYAHAAGVVVEVEVELGPLRSPDPETDAERYLATVAVYAHRH